MHGWKKAENEAQIYKLICRGRSDWLATTDTIGLIYFCIFDGETILPKTIRDDWLRCVFMVKQMGNQLFQSDFWTGSNYSLDKYKVVVLYEYAISALLHFSWLVWTSQRQLKIKHTPKRPHHVEEWKRAKAADSYEG